MMRPVNKRPVGETGSLHDDLWGQGQQSKRKPGRREAQGIALHRNPGQRPPTWPKPNGANCLAMLERLWGPPAKPQRSAENVLLDAAKLAHDGDAAGAAAAATSALRLLEGSR